MEHSAQDLKSNLDICTDKCSSVFPELNDVTY